MVATGVDVSVGNGGVVGSSVTVWVGVGGIGDGVFVGSGVAVAGGSGVNVGRAVLVVVGVGVSTLTIISPTEHPIIKTVSPIARNTR